MDSMMGWTADECSIADPHPANATVGVNTSDSERRIALQKSDSTCIMTRLQPCTAARGDLRDAAGPIAAGLRDAPMHLLRVGGFASRLPKSAAPSREMRRTRTLAL